VVKPPNPYEPRHLYTPGELISTAAGPPSPSDAGGGGDGARSASAPSSAAARRARRAPLLVAFVGQQRNWQAAWRSQLRFVDALAMHVAAELGEGEGGGKSGGGASGGRSRGADAAGAPRHPWRSLACLDEKDAGPAGE
jgi:hypothetical protein